MSAARVVPLSAWVKAMRPSTRAGPAGLGRRLGLVYEDGVLRLTERGRDIRDAVQYGWQLAQRVAHCHRAHDRESGQLLGRLQGDGACDAGPGGGPVAPHRHADHPARSGIGHMGSRHIDEAGREPGVAGGGVHRPVEDDVGPIAYFGERGGGATAALGREEAAGGDGRGGAVHPRPEEVGDRQRGAVRLGGDPRAKVDDAPAGRATQ